MAVGIFFLYSGPIAGDAPSGDGQDGTQVVLALMEQMATVTSQMFDYFTVHGIANIVSQVAEQAGQILQKFAQK